MTMLRLIGVIVAVGSLLFLAAAFHPISRVFGARGAEARLAIIENSPGAWRLSQTLFSAGAMVTAIGVGALVLVMDIDWPVLLRAVPFALLGIGSSFWRMHTGSRKSDPRAWVAGTLPGWQFPAYTILTILGLAVTGLAFLHTGPTWLGLTLSIGPALFLLVFLVFRDLPPLFHYLLTLALAVHLLVSG